MSVRSGVGPVTDVGLHLDDPAGEATTAARLVDQRRSDEILRDPEARPVEEARTESVRHDDGVA